MEIRDLIDGFARVFAELLETKLNIADLSVGNRHEIIVYAQRNDTQVSSQPFVKTVREYEQSPWTFNWFG